MKKIAMVTGMTGQDGPYLARFLLERDYQVYGLVKRYSNPNLENLRWLGIENQVELITGDITDENSMNHIIRGIRPAECYNLAAQSFVGISWDMNKLTTEVNAMGPLNILNAIRTHSPTTKFYQASTSEMFGNSTGETRQGMTTPFRPRSPYGVSKLYAHWITVNFRESYSLYACSGVLFNHESPLRGREFVTRKITDGVARIRVGLQDKITLGNLDAQRDWGFAGDFVEAMWMMLQQEEPRDYVLGTGVQHSIRDVCDVAFRHAGIEDWQHLVGSDPRFKRPAELHALRADTDEIREMLGWQPRTSFECMIQDMVDADLARLQPRQ
jgi:GDPmannose 4,6-dehydratase